MTDKQQIEDIAMELYNNQDKIDVTNPYEVAELIYNINYRKVPKDALVLTKQEKQKLLHDMYEQGKFDAIALLTNGSMQSKVESSMKDLLDKIDGYLAKGENYCGSLASGLLAAKMIIALYFRNEVAQLEKKAKALVSVSDVFGEICDPVATPFDIDDGDMPF